MTSSQTSPQQSRKPGLSGWKFVLSGVGLVVGAMVLMMLLNLVVGNQISLSIDRGSAPGTLHLSWNPVRGATQYEIEEDRNDVTP